MKELSWACPFQWVIVSFFYYLTIIFFLVSYCFQEGSQWIPKEYIYIIICNRIRKIRDNRFPKICKIKLQKMRKYEPVKVASVELEVCEGLEPLQYPDLFTLDKFYHFYIIILSNCSSFKQIKKQYLLCFVLDNKTITIKPFWYFYYIYINKLRITIIINFTV